MRKFVLPFAAIVFISTNMAAVAGPAQDKVLQHYQAQAKSPASIERGKQIFTKRFGTGKPKMPSCTVCHGKTPYKTGKTRVGKKIDPMALSRTKDRFSNLKKVEKWFRRNCKNVIGRECTAQEKSDFLAFMMSK